jgi:hypothetical protein
MALFFHTYIFNFKTTKVKQIITGLLLTVFTCAGLYSSAQIRKVPAEVTDAFKAKYPDAVKVEWGDKVTAFEATFEQETHKFQSNFSSKGEWKFTEKFLTPEELPAPVKDGFDKSKYSDWDIISHVEVTEANGTHQYRLYVKKNDLQKKFLYFNTDGKLAKDAITL